MAIINANWTLGSPITAQRISVKKTDETTWNNSPFDLYDTVTNTLITNDFSPTINSVRIENLLFNVDYDVRVENVVAGVATSCNMISQFIKFLCVNDKGNNFLYVTNITGVGFDVQVTNLTNYIDKIKFHVYDSAGTTLITTSPFINVTANQAGHTFTGLSANTSYRVYYQMASTITNNNITGDKLSDIFGAVVCYDSVTTLNNSGFVTLFNNATPTGCTTTVDITDGVNTYQIQATGAGTGNNILIPYGTYDITISKPCNCNPLIDDFDCNGVFNSAGTFTGIVLNSSNSIDCTAHCI